MLPEDTNPDQGFRYIDIGAVGRGCLISEPTAMTFDEAPSRARRIVADGDTVVSTVRTYLRAVWPVQPPTEGLVVSTGFAVISPRGELDPRFFGWFAQSDPFIEKIVARSVGVSYPGVRPEEIGDVSVPVYPLPTQRAIADFLDTETARIDALIEKKQRIVSLMEERFFAALETEMSKTEAPLVPLRRLARFIDYRGATPEKAPEGVPLVTAANVKNGRIDLEAEPQFLSPSVYSEWMRRGFPKPGDVLMTTEAPLGEVAQVDDPMIGLAQRVILLQIDAERVNSTYLAFALRAASFQADLARHATGSTAAGIKAERLKGLPLPVPSLLRQSEVVLRLSELSACVERLNAHLLQQVRLLREHREALITAAVTGELAVAWALA